MRRRSGQPQQLQRLVQSYLGGKGYMRQSREVLAALLWSEVVGEWYARHTRVLEVSEGVLQVWCDSAPHAQQLQADAQSILDRLQERVERELSRGEEGEATPVQPFLTELRASSAGGGRRDRYQWTRPGGPAPSGVDPRELEKIALTHEEKAEAERLAAALASEELREKFRQAYLSSLRLLRWKRSHGYRPCSACGRLLPPGEKICLSCRPPAPPPGLRE
jgi:predicted nucleic acid-binding Zn ribbon protein